MEVEHLPYALQQRGDALRTQVWRTRAYWGCGAGGKTSYIEIGT
jgi:hypothetical protein